MTQKMEWYTLDGENYLVVLSNSFNSFSFNQFN
jgi:hypothetical protein